MQLKLKFPTCPWFLSGRTWKTTNINSICLTVSESYSLQCRMTQTCQQVYTKKWKYFYCIVLFKDDNEILISTAPKASGLFLVSVHLFLKQLWRLHSWPGRRKLGQHEPIVHMTTSSVHFLCSHWSYKYGFKIDPVMYFYFCLWVLLFTYFPRIFLHDLDEEERAVPVPSSGHSVHWCTSEPCSGCRSSSGAGRPTARSSVLYETFDWTLLVKVIVSPLSWWVAASAKSLSPGRFWEGSPSAVWGSSASRRSGIHCCRHRPAGFWSWNLWWTWD